MCFPNACYLRDIGSFKSSRPERNLSSLSCQIYTSLYFSHLVTAGVVCPGISGGVLSTSCFLSLHPPMNCTLPTDLWYVTVSKFSPLLPLQLRRSYLWLTLATPPVNDHHIYIHDQFLPHMLSPPMGSSSSNRNFITWPSCLNPFRRTLIPQHLPSEYWPWDNMPLQATRWPVPYASAIKICWYFPTFQGLSLLCDFVGF